jgi:hypothetical protein
MHAKGNYIDILIAFLFLVHTTTYILIAFLFIQQHYLYLIYYPLMRLLMRIQVNTTCRGCYICLFQVNKKIDYKDELEKFFMEVEFPPMLLINNTPLVP